MKKHIYKVLLMLIIIGGFIFATKKVSIALDTIKFTFEKKPLFSQINTLPGDSVTRWIKVANSSGSTQKIALKTKNQSDPNRLGVKLKLKIKEDGKQIWAGDLSISSFLSGNVIELTNVANSAITQYDLEVYADPSIENDFGWKNLSFDIVAGFENSSNETIGEKDTYTFIEIDNESKKINDDYDENKTKIAGVASMSIEEDYQGEYNPELEDAGDIGGGIRPGDGQAKGIGFVLGQSIRGKTSEESGEPSLTVSAENCRGIWWWPIGYMVYVILILVVVLMGVDSKLFKVWRLIGQGVLVAISLLWWLLEPCGTLVWWWPIVLVLFFVIAFRQYFRRVAGY